MISSYRGMTLVEVTVATVIFSMIMLATVTALQTFAGTYAKLEKITARTAQMREADRFLRVTLRAAINRPDFFEGGLHELHWVAPIDRVGSVVGLQHLRLSREGNRLLLSFAPVAESDTPPAWGSVAPAFPLVSELDSLRFFYQPTSVDSWSEGPFGGATDSTSVLPRAIAIEVVSDGQLWPPLVVLLDAHRPPE